MKIKNCKNCNKEIKTSPSNELIRKFCSFLCRKSIYTPEMKLKMSIIKKEQFKNGIQPWNKGKRMSEEYCSKISKTLKDKTGENSRNWKGGITYFSVRAKRKRENGGSHTFGEWEIMKAQYNWTCPSCKLSGIELVKDHIIPLAKGGSDNIQNIQPLCRSCNAKKHTRIERYEFELVEKQEICQ